MSIQSMLHEMSKIYYNVNKQSGNELRAHPVTIDWLCFSINKEEIDNQTDLLTRVYLRLSSDKKYVDGTWTINLIGGEVVLIRDNTIPPGTFFLDRDGATKREPKARYYTWDELSPLRRRD